MEKWINIHTHRLGAGVNILDPCLGDLSVEEHVVYYSRGIHPKFIGTDVEQKLAELEYLAESGKIVAIGEAGLDRTVPVAMTRQQDIFERQMDIASRYDLPLIVHVVKAIPELIGVSKRYPAFKKIIIHGFNNRREILEDLLTHGFYISAGKKMLDENSHIWHLLPEIPLDKLFVETDDADCPIADIYIKTAGRKKIEVQYLQKIVATNFKFLFKSVILPFE